MSSPTYLLVDTCGDSGLAALAVDGLLVACEMLPAKSSSEVLIPAIGRVLKGRRLREIHGVGVVTGPGSFTGVRSGLSAVKGLCEAKELPILGMSRLALLAGDSLEKRMALLDAGRGEFFYGIYEAGHVIEEGLLGRLSLLERMERMEGMRAVTSDAAVARTLEQQVLLVPEPDARGLLAWMEREVAAGRWSDAATLDANYLRRPDAELLVSK